MQHHPKVGAVYSNEPQPAGPIGASAIIPSNTAKLSSGSDVMAEGSDRSIIDGRSGALAKT
jgi:hypothetical protein